MFSLRRVTHRLALVLALSIVTLLLLIYSNNSHLDSTLSTLSTLSQRHASQAKGLTQQLQLTTILAHAPGFTVFENL